MPRTFDADGNIISSDATPAIPVKRAFDADGNVIGGSKGSSSGPQLKAPRTFLQDVDKNLMDQLPLILGAMGGIAGSGPMSVPMMALGAGLGSSIRNIGNPDPADAATDFGVETVAPLAMHATAGPLERGLLKAFKFIKSPLESLSSFPIHGGAEGIADAAAASNTGAPISVGQMTRSKIPQYLERNLAPAAEKQALLAEQESFKGSTEDALRRKFTGSSVIPPSPAEQYGADVSKGIRANLSDVTDDVTQAYNRVKFDAKSAARDVQVRTGTQEVPNVDPRNPAQTVTVPKYETKRIEGPIDIGDNTRGWATNVGAKFQQLADELPDSSFLKSKYAKAADSLNQIAHGTGDSGVMPWEVVKELRTEINSKTFDKLDKTRLQGGLSKLATLLDKDIDSSVSKWAPGALDRLNEANSLASDKASTFTTRILNTVKKDPSQVLNLSRTNPEAAREVLDALGPDKQRAVKGQFFEELMAKAKSDPSAALDLLDSPSNRTVFSSSDRSDLIPFLRTIRRLQPDTSQAGTYRLSQRGVGIALTGLKAGYDIVKGDNSKALGDTALGASVLLSSRAFASKVLLNPKYARAAVRLASLPADSGEATILRRGILAAMKGTQAVLEMDNGEKREVTINSEGKFASSEDK